MSLKLSSSWLLGLLYCYSTTLYANTVTVSVVDGDGKPVSAAVVFLESTAASAALQAAAPVKIVQRDKSFIPEITIVPRGTAVSFPNEDTVRHHVYSFSPVKQFEIKLYVGTPTEPVVFEQSGVAVLGCNIHDEMIAWVVVLDTPYYASSDAAGMVNLSNIPEGDYTLRVWHKDLLSETDIPSIALSVTATNSPQRVILPQLVPMF
ncbi:methylamine utilization protein [Alishewanella longhuensis]|uniref:methylamine utilization protein n=1 Tax=Alishewanella longhuensis TaxID=1091037 RepID=UPI0016720648|nr:methylamine utilization protein [Alishewanella longhuensis]